MKITNNYEVWVGGDMIDDMLDYNTARLIAEKEFKEAGKDLDQDVVIDEIRHYTIESLDDLTALDEL